MTTVSSGYGPPGKNLVKKTGLHLGRSVDPSAYFESTGRKSAFLGLENGTSEVWIYPYKVLHNLRLYFLVGDEEEWVSGAESASRVDVYPHQTVIRFVRSSFCVEAVYFTPLYESGAVLLLDVDSKKPLSIVVGFTPDLKPMWPAGLGGQYSYWNEESKYFVISEGSRRNTALIGSPRGIRYSTGPAHALPENEARMRIDIDMESAEQRLYPVYISASKENRGDAENIYKRLQENLAEYYEEKHRYYTSLRDDFLYIRTPDKRLDRAFQWAKIAVDKAFVCNPQLGCGLVAGYGLSRKSERPGFAWFFGGDAFFNAWAVNSYGDFSLTRQALTFIRENQRSDGKIMHELSQGAAFIDWFEDYPYGYYHAETSPYYIIALRDYYAQSGDEDFLEESWTSLEKAYDYVLSADTDGDGLMENTVAGLAALELGSFLNRTKTDVYLAALSVESHLAFSGLAGRLGKEPAALKAERAYRKSLLHLNRDFWVEKDKRPAHALTVTGRVLDEKTIWPFMPLFFRHLPEDKAESVLNLFASSEMSTDWGVRSLSPQSIHYDPLNYNYGSVWPFLTGYTCLAEYRYGRKLSAYAHLRALVQNTFIDALGYCPELLSGEYFVPIETSVPHQVFSSSPVISSTVRGLMGLEGRAFQKEFDFSPRCPGYWTFYDIKNIRVGKTLFHISAEKKEDRWLFRFEQKEGEPIRCSFAPTLGWGARVTGLRINGNPVKYTEEKEGGLTVCRSDFELSRTTEAEVFFRGGVDFFVPPAELKLGDASSQLKIISAVYNDHEIVLEVEGRGGTVYEFDVLTDRTLRGIEGAALVKKEENLLKLSVAFEGTSSRYFRKSIHISFSLEARIKRPVTKET